MKLNDYEIIPGAGASSFAKELGLAMLPTDQLISRKAQTTYNYYKKKIRDFESSNSVQVSASDTPSAQLDTVGAIAIDDYGEKHFQTWFVLFNNKYYRKYCCRMFFRRNCVKAIR